MKRFFALCGGGLLAVLLLAVAVRAEEIKNQYFTLELPSGWHLESFQKILDVSIFVVADSSRKNLANITVISLGKHLPAKDVCTIICNAQKVNGAHIGEPVAAGESYVVEFSQGKAHGFQYFTATGTLASAVSVIGDGGKELMQKHFKPVDPKLFPASY